MSRAHDRGPSEVALLDETIGANFERAVARDPAHEALVSCHQGRRFTYAELDAQVNRVARGLLARGIAKGDRVGMWSPNNAEWVLVQFATAKIGAILVNINPAYRSSELEYALAQSGCRLLVSAPSFKTSDYVAMLAEVRPRLDALEAAIFLDSPEWGALLAAGDAESDDALRERFAGLAPDDAINIQYTSGTTGFPKGATLTHRNILNNGYFTGLGCGYGPEDRICIPVPFYHCFGMVMGNLGAVSHGATMVLPNDAFEPGSVLAAVEAERCTSLYGVPTMFIAELAHPEFARFDLASLRTGIMAGSPCPVDTMKEVIERMHMSEVCICYGMTETSPVSTQTAGGDPIERRTGSVGRVHPHVEIKVIDPETGSVCQRGEIGEFCTRGYSVMQGYWNDAERTVEAIDAAGFMHTGDLAVMDAAGYVNIVGRIKDMIIRGGENVYPREIEEYLHGHPDIADVQVIGVPDERLGEELMAWIQVRAGAELSEAAVKDYCRGRIAHYKVPRYVKFADEFPLTVTGKVQKFKMREMAIAELALTETQSG
ncbi:MAG: AMP-binding protein [Deltaproteobacteria bacterium]|nr:AMP-binding protein [Deltaproteobacteria bacterium]MBW2362363.1 AMP-binding protein [Deltaproteobacteria bacterium]